MDGFRQQTANPPIPLPKEVHGWVWDGKCEVYDAKTIFDYIDGIGEVYRAYNMRTVWACRYERTDQPTLTLDIFDMGTSDDAYGIFSFERDGEDVRIGQQAEYSGGMLRFWKGRYFVAITAYSDSAEGRQAILALGRVVANGIANAGTLPQLLSLLPAVGLQKERVLFFRHYMILNRHFFVANRDILNLSPHTEGVLGTYQRGAKARFRIVILRYPTESDAIKAWNLFAQTYLREGRASGVVRTENGRWTSAKRQSRYIAIVFETATQREAIDILKSVKLP